MCWFCSTLILAPIKLHVVAIQPPAIQLPHVPRPVDLRSKTIIAAVKDNIKALVKIRLSGGTWIAMTELIGLDKRSWGAVRKHFIRLTI